MEKWKWLFSVICGALATFSRQYMMIVIFVAIAVVMDVITGVIKAKLTGEGLSSKKGTIGFWKKIALFCGLFFGFFLDYFIPYIASTIGISYPFETAVFGMIIGCYIVLNESISVCENLYRANPDILPSWVVKILTQAKQEIDDKGNAIENESK